MDFKAKKILGNNGLHWAILVTNNHGKLFRLWNNFARLGIIAFLLVITNLMTRVKRSRRVENLNSERVKLIL